MSRCFPFPPPGYVLNGIRDEALIVSIKGEEEKAKKEQRRKERKKYKKDKKEKKRKEREGKEGESQKHSHKRRRKEEGAKDDGQVDVFRKLKGSEIDCLEKSSLTVERELLQSTSQNSCDSTLNSNEILLPKQKEKQPHDGRHNNDSESIIRIRLPIRRQKDPEVILTNKDQQIPRGLKLDSSQLATREPVNEHPCSTSAPEHVSKPREEKRKDPVFTPKLSKEKMSSSSTPEHVSKPHEEKRKDPVFTTKPGKEKKISSSSTRETSQPSSLCRICPPSMALQFMNVVENWVPNTIERRVELTNSEDEECWWLMKKPSSQKFGTERCKQLNISNEMKQVSNSMAWPCARLLPEADVHALPYTVPF